MVLNVIPFTPAIVPVGEDAADQRGLVLAHLDPPHLMLPPAEFEKVITRGTASEPTLGGVTLDGIEFIDAERLLPLFDRNLRVTHLNIALTETEIALSLITR